MARTAQELAKAKARQAANTLKKSKNSKILSNDEAKKSASSSVSKESKELAKAQKEYLASLNPSAEETAATSSLGKINQEAEQQAAKIRDPRQNTVAMPFVERQTEALSNQTEQRVIPLKYQIAALQSQREARGNVAQAKYKFAGENYNKKVKQDTDPLDTEYKQLRNENLKSTIKKRSNGGSGNKEEKDYAKDLAASQQAILKGTSNREIEMQTLNTKYKKNLNQQDILKDGYSVLKKKSRGR